MLHEVSIWEIVAQLKTSREELVD